jgi:hypothetical protein
MSGKAEQEKYQLLTKNQEQVLRYLQKNKHGVSFRKIEEETGITYCNVRNSILALIRYKIIKEPEKDKVGNNIRMNIEFLDDAFVVDNPTDEQKEACIKNKAQDILDTHAEFGYWREQGLVSQQIHQWHDEFGVKYEALQLSLRWCAFDMVYNNVETEKNIKSPINWFYSILKNGGGLYPKPKNYKTADERMAEMLEERAKEKAEIAERLRVARIREAYLDHEIAFEKMMADPESELYKKCFSMIDDYSKKRHQMKKNKNTIMFVKSMRAAYSDIHGLEDPNDVKSYLKNINKEK